MRQKLLQLPILLFLLLIFVQSGLPQTVKTEKKDETLAKTEKKDEISPELRKEAVVFLRETAIEANNLRTPENRISFASEIAGLMWFADE